MKAKSWFNLHHFCGFFFGLLLLWVSFTGTLAVLSYEVQYLSDDKFQASQPYQGQVNWQQLEQQLNQHYSGYQIQDARLQSSDYHAGEVRIRNQQEVKYVYFDATTGHITGEGSYGRYSRFLRDIHRNLSMGAEGKWLVCLMSLLLIGLFISSFQVYKNWWHGFKRLPSYFKASNKRSFWSDSHKLSGVYSLWFIAVMGFTGSFYLYEHGASQLGAPIYKVPLVATANTDEQQALPFSQLLETAKQHWPQLEIRQFSYPVSYNGSFSVSGQTDAMLTIDRGNTLWLDMYTGKVLNQQRAQELSPLVRLGDAMDYFHFGTLGGLTTKLIWFGFGLILCVLSITGMRMYWLRVRRQQPSILKWLGAGGVFSVIIILVSTYLTIVNFAQFPNNEGTAPYLYSSQ
ncbi:PepSY domain-containing protein [Paraferrimonas sp. SM1919]|uniref:PepSY-associated TM helix domain-containing protein n=1 Tax=Paraferrimonas sp. SM1919 TaxID=2662263 RepID=UPI0013D59D28|nr:PepSY-associated TM helix domain-containing protein [Paraferrimonas sp. SM1919]